MMQVRGLSLCYAGEFTPDRQEADERRERLNTLYGKKDSIKAQRYCRLFY